jgi:NAD(P)H-hydrate epimerase
VVGPGIGISDRTAGFLDLFFQEVATQRKQVVIDADALTLIARRGISLSGIEAILTPHPGEAARLGNSQVSDVQQDRFTAARSLAEKYGCVTLLKGAGTIIHNGRCGAVVARGTPYLATPGSGDVLAGVIATCIPQAGTLFDAAVCGAHIHACAGECASHESGGVILASDVARAVAGVIPRYTVAVDR